MIRMFGTTLRETLDAFAPADKRPHLGEGIRRENAVESSDLVKAIVRTVVTLVLLFVGVYCLLAMEGQPQQIGIALLGLVGGYWLK